MHAAAFEQFGFAPVRQEAVVPDAQKSLRQDVSQEAAQELVRGHLGDLALIAVFPIAVVGWRLPRETFASSGS
jgi:hypothetical protein